MGIGCGHKEQNATGSRPIPALVCRAGHIARSFTLAETLRDRSLLVITVQFTSDALGRSREIMILRPLRTRFTTHDRSAVAVQLLVVVLGVLMGIPVSNWNQARATGQQSPLVTDHRRAGLREEHWGNQLPIAYSQEVLKNAGQAVNSLSGKTPISGDALVIIAYRATHE